MLLAHISDLHVIEPGKLAYGVVDTTPMVENAIAHLNTLSPDLIVITGDLVHNVHLVFRHLARRGLLLARWCLA